MHLVIEFEWDERKANASECQRMPTNANGRKHGVSFQEASTTFYDPLGLEMRDQHLSAHEERWLLLGESSKQRVLVTVFVERGDRIRILLSRVATRRERSSYEEGV